MNIPIVPQSAYLADAQEKFNINGETTWVPMTNAVVLLSSQSAAGDEEYTAMMVTFMEENNQYSAYDYLISKGAVGMTCKEFLANIDKYTSTAISVPKSKETTMVGDVNTDGQATISDAIVLSRYVAEDTTVPITDAGIAVADLNEDGNVNADDTTVLLKMLAGLAQ